MMMWRTLIVLWLSQQVSLLTLSENSVSFSLNLSLYPTISSASVCLGSLKVNRIDASQLLVGLCSTSNSSYAGGIGFLSLSSLSNPLQVVYGDIASPAVIRDDVRNTAGIISPQHLHQTSDNKRILFVDNGSCAREIDRNSGKVSTVIGVGSCLTHTLDMNLSSGLVSGMAYEESLEVWIFSLRGHGVFVYWMDASTGNYSGELLVALENLSVSLLDICGQLYARGDIWHKVQHGINRYTLHAVNNTTRLTNGSVTLVRYLSSAGPGATADPTAVYQYSVEELRLGAGNADLELSPDGNTLLIVDLSRDRLFLLHTSDGNLLSLCLTLNRSACVFPQLAAGAWVDDFTLLVAKNDPAQLRRLQLDRTQPSSSTVKIYLTSTRPSTNGNKDKSTWWMVLAIVCGFCFPLLIFWVAVKVIQFRRHGLVFDIFSEEDNGLDPMAARKVNFLYNKAARGEKYEKRKDDSNLNELKKVSSKRHRSKSADGKKKKRKVPVALESAARAISDRFKLPKRKKKRVSKDGMDDELCPLPEASSRTKAKKHKRDSVDINFMGSTVSVPMTKTLVGRARPLPPLPMNETI